MLSHSTTLYLATVLIWGSTWFAIKFQLGVVAPEVSVVYRFALASLALLGFCAWRRLALRFNARAHAWMAAQGLFLFGLNYVVLYWATETLTSGLIAVVFSTIVLMNIFLAALFFAQRIEPVMVAGALAGLAGIALVFWPQLTALSERGAWQGVALSVLGTAFASLGNMVSQRNQGQRLPVIQSNAFGMGYGAALMAVWALARGAEWTYDPAPAYTVSMLYLVLFGSILAFGGYLTLLGRIGAARAAYAMVVFPLVALGISTLFEDYRWTPAAGTGVLLVLAGNALVIASRPGAGRGTLAPGARSNP